MTVEKPIEEPDKKIFEKCGDGACGAGVHKKRLPILQWLPNYKKDYLIQDIIAGITVGLTAIPQGIAYAFIAGLPPEYGLYASLTSGLVYAVFGSCYNVTVGPTAILATLTAKYVSGYSPEFAVLAAFLSGLLVLLMGVLHLGFLIEFISMPVINGFTTAAALQIAASQLKSLFGLSGHSGEFFAESIYNFGHNITTIQLWDTALGVGTLVMLGLLKMMGNGCKRTDGWAKKLRWFFSLSRNAVVVVFGMAIAYTLKVTIGTEPVATIGDIGHGLPKFGLPPFDAVVGNETYTFSDMLHALGPSSIVLPLVALLESLAIGKAFADGATVDATQEMIALGMCNIIGSFGMSMPITGSFTRTALNHFSGVKTPLAGVANVALIFIALTLLTSAFSYIPKASLAGLIIFAMYSMIHVAIFKSLWNNSKREFFVIAITMVVCMFVGIEYGIIIGIVLEAIMLLYRVARPPMEVKITKCEKADVMVIPLTDSVSYCAAEHVRREVLKASQQSMFETLIIIDGTNLKSIDFTVASNLMSVVKDLEKKSRQIVFMNFNLDLKSLCLDVDASSETKFAYASNPVELSDRTTKDV